MSGVGVPGLAEVEQLYERDYARFVRVARAILGDSDRAVEAVQEGFVDVVRGLGGYRGEGSFEGWVWRVVVNRVRRSARRPLVAVTESTDPATDELPAVVSDVAPLVSALPERQRLVVFLRYYADLDYRAIASALGIEVGTVAATLSAAHAAIRRGMKEVEGRAAR